jgi:hypothetical protein
LRRALHAAAVAELFVGIWSPWIIAELNRVLTWDWIQRSRGNEQACSMAAKRMMELLLPTFELINPLPPYPTAWPELKDVWDEPVWAAAVGGHASHVVSENTQDFPPLDASGRHRYQGIEYIRGADFLSLLDLDL